MLTKIVEARMIELQNSNVSFCVYIRAIAANEDTKTEKQDVVKKDSKGRRIFNVNLFNKSMFPDVYHTVLFPTNEETVDYWDDLCTENEGKEENEVDYGYINLVKQQVPCENVGGAESYIMRYTRDSDDGSFKEGDVILDDNGDVKVFDNVTVVLLADEDDKPVEDAVRKARNRYKQNVQFDDSFGFSVWQPYSEYIQEMEELKAKEEAKKGHANDGGSEFADRANRRNHKRQTNKVGVYIEMYHISHFILYFITCTKMLTTQYMAFVTCDSQHLYVYIAH